MKKVLVTGVAGFIASKTAELLLKEGVEVVGIDNLNDYDENEEKFKNHYVSVPIKNYSFMAK